MFLLWIGDEGLEGLTANQQYQLYPDSEANLILASSNFDLINI